MSLSDSGSPPVSHAGYRGSIRRSDAVGPRFWEYRSLQPCEAEFDSPAGLDGAIGYQLDRSFFKRENRGQHPVASLNLIIRV